MKKETFIDSNFQQYKAWADSAKCVDCGKEKDGTEVWVTEVQCQCCFSKLGPTEWRGVSAQNIRAY